MHRPTSLLGPSSHQRPCLREGRSPRQIPRAGRGHCIMSGFRTMPICTQTSRHPNPQGLLRTCLGTQTQAETCLGGRRLHFPSMGQVLPQAQWFFLAPGPEDSHRNTADSLTKGP